MCWKGHPPPATATHQITLPTLLPFCSPHSPTHLLTPSPTLHTLSPSHFIKPPPLSNTAPPAVPGGHLWVQVQHAGALRGHPLRLRRLLQHHRRSGLQAHQLPKPLSQSAESSAVLRCTRSTAQHSPRGAAGRWRPWRPAEVPAHPLYARAAAALAVWPSPRGDGQVECSGCASACTAAARVASAAAAGSIVITFLYRWLVGAGKPPSFLPIGPSVTAGSILLQGRCLVGGRWEGAVLLQGDGPCPGGRGALPWFKHECCMHTGGNGMIYGCHARFPLGQWFFSCKLVSSCGLCSLCASRRLFQLSVCYVLP